MYLKMYYFNIFVDFVQNFFPDAWTMFKIKSAQPLIDANCVLILHKYCIVFRIIIGCVGQKYGVSGTFGKVGTPGMVGQGTDGNVISVQMIGISTVIQAMTQPFCLAFSQDEGLLPVRLLDTGCSS